MANGGKTMGNNVEAKVAVTIDVLTQLVPFIGYPRTRSTRCGVVDEVAGVSAAGSATRNRNEMS